MSVAKGLAAGAVGTTLLNVVTYLDMAVRGRPASSLPAADVERMADQAGISLGASEERASARTEALGALMGFVAGGLGGAAYGAVRPHVRWIPWPLAAVAAGVGVMIVTDASSTALGTTDPRDWGAVDWVSDVVPHLAYGAGVALSFDALNA